MLKPLQDWSFSIKNDPGTVAGETNKAGAQPVIPHLLLVDTCNFIAYVSTMLGTGTGCRDRLFAVILSPEGRKDPVNFSLLHYKNLLDPSFR